MKLSNKILPACATAAALYSAPALAQDSAETDWLKPPVATQSYDDAAWLKTPACELSKTISFKTSALTADGFEADKNPVIQLSLDTECEGGVYGNMWANVPVTDEFPSEELNFTIGKVWEVLDGELDTSVAYFDISNPDLLDFKGDIISPSAAFSKEHWYAMVNGYLAKDGNGVALELGLKDEFRVGDFEVSVNTGPRFVSGPFDAPEIAYLNSGMSVSHVDLPQVSVGAEAITILDKSREDDRDSALALGLHYNSTF